MANAVSILVVEDHPETLELMCEILRSRGYDVVGVDTAESGLAELRTRKYAVVISDHWLDRGASGTWMLVQAAQERLLETTPAIMCSAERRLEGLPAGVPVMTKPVDFHVLIDAIKRLAGSRSRSLASNDVQRAKTRAVLYVTHSATSQRALRHVHAWRDDLARAGVEIEIVDLEREPTRANIEADRVTSTPLLVVETDVGRARYLGELDEATVEDVLALASGFVGRRGH